MCESARGVKVDKQATKIIRTLARKHDCILHLTYGLRQRERENESRYDEEKEAQRKKLKR
jgi:hypothetical protein